MLYCHGPVHVFIGCITSFSGVISSQNQSSKLNLTPVPPGTSYTPTGTVITTKVPPTPQNPWGFMPIKNNVAQALFNVDAQAPEQNIPPPAVDQPEGQLPNLGAQDPANPQIFSIGSFAPTQLVKPEPQTITITRPFIINSVQVYYLGTGVMGPQVDVRRRYKTFYQTDTGRQVEYDKAYAGKDAIIPMTLNNWNYWVYSIIGARMNQRTPGGGPEGVDTIDSIGSLLMTEGLAYMLWLQFPNSAKSLMGQGGMPAGYRFFCTYLLHDRILPGQKQGRLQLTWHALKYYDFSTGNQWLYDSDMSLLPQLTSVYS